MPMATKAVRVGIAPLGEIVVEHAGFRILDAAGEVQSEIEADIPADRAVEQQLALAARKRTGRAVQQRREVDALGQQPRQAHQRAQVGDIGVDGRLDALLEVGDEVPRVPAEDLVAPVACYSARATVPGFGFGSVRYGLGT